LHIILLNYCSANQAAAHAIAQASTLLESFKSQELANLIWACARLGFSAGSAFLRDVVRVLARMKSGFRAQDLCNIAWGLAVVDFLTHDAVAAIADKVRKPLY
jgi:hypothetical protein